MKHFYYAALFVALVTSAKAQSYNPGLPVPGLPKSLGQKTSAQSTSVTIASDQSSIPITGSITATNPSVGTNFATAPMSSTLVGYYDSSGKLQPFTGNAAGITVTANQGTSPWVSSIPSGVAITNTATVSITGSVQEKSPINLTGNLNSGSISVTTTVSAPANAAGFLIEALSNNTDNIRFSVGSVSSATNGVRLEPGRSEFIPLGANISVCPESGNQNYVIQWVSQ